MKNIILKLVICLALPLWLMSCEEKGIVEDEIPSRTFRPTQFRQVTSGITVTLAWNPLANVTYVLEISRDSLVFETDLMTFTMENTDQFQYNDLWSQQRYSARIKAINKNPNIEPSKYASITWRAGSENIFVRPVPSGDISTNQIMVKWDHTKEVDRITVIMIKEDREEMTSVNLTSEDKTAGQKTINGLESNTAYTFRIYQGERLRGEVIVTTTI